jgi:STAM-binding protein
MLTTDAQAGFAIRDGDFSRAYLMLWRHSNLVLKHLPTHPEYVLPESKAVFKPLFGRQKKVLVQLEKIKPYIEREYNEWKQMTAFEDWNKDQRDIATPSSTPTTYRDYAARDPSLRGNAKVLDAAENQELAVDLAQREFRRRDAARKATREAGVTEEEEKERRKAGTWDNWDTFGSRTDDDDLRRQMEATRRRLDATEERRGDDSSYRTGDLGRQNTEATLRARPHAYRYPSISKPKTLYYDTNHIENQRESRVQPPLPPKERSDSFQVLRAQPPTRPDKQPLPRYEDLTPSAELPGYDAPSLPPKEEIFTPPKKERLTFRPAAYLENGDPIRPVFLPRDLRRAFLEVAAENTRKGVEMCGILCGTPVNNALFISCLLIPEQKCTPDTCETENESAMLDYCINEDLLMIGWIHTHPTQTCFMSSRDLHTQAGYQVMMPESIAVVCSPKFTPSSVIP